MSNGWDVGGRRVITRALIQEQLAELTTRSTLWSAQAEQFDPRPKVVLRWSTPDGNGEEYPVVAGLGVYAKWLVALDFALADLDPDEDCCEFLGVQHQALRRLFDPYIDQEKRVFRKPERYDPTSASLENAEFNAVLQAVLRRVNDRLKRNGNRQITAMDFAAYDAAISPEESVVGIEPIQRFRYWLTYRTGGRARYKSSRRLDSHEPAVHGGLTHSVAMGVRTAYDLRPAHACIANIWSPSKAANRVFIDELEGDLAGQFAGRERVVVTLAAGESPASVIRKLRELVHSDSDASDAASRPVDLDRDVNEIRRALTIKPHLLVFVGWDNAVGPLAALHDFLCNTHWGEFLRVIAQPQREAMLHSEFGAKSDSLMVVLSTAPAEELRPWCFMQQRVADAAVAQAVDASQIGDRMRRLLKNPEARPIEAAVVRLIAASVNGMQRGTLERCVQQWGSLFDGGGDRAEKVDASSTSAASGVIASPLLIHDVLEQVLETYERELHEVLDEDTPGLTEAIRHVELNRRPVAPEAGDSAFQSAKSLQFKSRVARTEFIRSWIEIEGVTTGLPMGGSQGAFSWGAINYVLAEESLRQATAMIRHVDSNLRESAATVCRFAQAVYHGLAGVDRPLISVGSSSFLAESRYGATIPPDPISRYRYFYLFVYRQCIEGNEWRLGRALGRSDVRLDLLTLFLRPEHSRWLLQQPKGQSVTKLLPDLYVVEPNLPFSDPSLRCDLLIALGSAGMDVGSDRGRTTTAWTLSVLPGWRLATNVPGDPNAVPGETHLINAKLPPREGGYHAAADLALKLRIDWLQSDGGRDQLVAAENLCLEQLERAGVSGELIQRLALSVGKVIEGAWLNRPGVTNSLSGALDSAVAAIAKQVSAPGARQFISEILFRLAEVFATRADDWNSDGQGQLALHDKRSVIDPIVAAFAGACAVYWVADRLRAGVGSEANSNLSWPLAGARALRYYVRACLKLARLILEGMPESRPQRSIDLTEALLEHAQNRLGLFTRHHFRYRRERVSALLLESARLRSWVRVSADHIRASAVNRLVTLAISPFLLDRALEHAEFALNAARGNQRGVNRSGMKRAKVRAKADVEAAEKYLAILRERGQQMLGDLDGVIAGMVKELKDQSGVLLEAADRLDQAEGLLLTLGFQRTHVRRLYLERVKFVTTYVRLLAVDLRVDLALATANDVVSHLNLELKALPTPHKRQLAPPTEAEIRAQLGHLSQLVRLEVHAMAATGKLERHLAIAEIASSGLRATSDGDGYWSAIYRRQQASLGLTRKRALELVEVS